jgi:hypothetical protein
MNKFLIFAVISASLVAAIYSASTYVAYAETITYCSYNKSKTKSFCSNIDDSGPSTDVTNWNCTKNKNGSWSCTEASTQPPTPDLKNAINGAISNSLPTNANPGTNQGASGGKNITIAGEGKVLKHGGALKGDETSSNAPTNNTDILQ